MVVKGHIPYRTCVSCRKKAQAKDLIKLKLVEGELTVIRDGRFVEGRGCYVCPSESCIEKARRKNLFSRALKSPVSANFAGIDLSKEG